jgi:hypothetical protein
MVLPQFAGALPPFRGGLRSLKSQAANFGLGSPSTLLDPVNRLPFDV